jgi:hypothetical protein
MAYAEIPPRVFYARFRDKLGVKGDPQGRTRPMSTMAELYAALKHLKKKPKAIAVSTDMWATLKKAGVVEFAACPLPPFRASDKFPVFQGSIAIIVNPALDGQPKTFLLPGDMPEVRVGAQERRKPSDRRQKDRRDKAK